MGCAMVEEAYLPIAFDSQIEEDNLKRIDFLGVPAERLEGGEYRVSENSENFLNDCVAKGLFKANRTLSQYSFESLKIWLYDTNKHRNSQGYPLPEVDKIAIKLSSYLEASVLKCISVVEFGVSGN